MINKRLINTVSTSKPYIFKNVLFQWLGLVANIALLTILAMILAQPSHNHPYLLLTFLAIGLLAIRSLSFWLANQMTYRASKEVKLTLRPLIFKSILRQGMGYKERFKTSELTQLLVEGVEQLEAYFGSYLPQFFYALIAPLTLFVYLSFIDLKVAFVLFICVPLIPVSIVLVQKFAKQLLAKYWGKYVQLGDTFLESLYGLTTYKIYQTDEYQQAKMNEQAEHFRKITMRVLTMQLNSISVMDLIAYGGAALGVYLAVGSLSSQTITLVQALIILLLAADFFIPMRLLGSYFHIAMNGLAASKKIFACLDATVIEDGSKTIEQWQPLVIADLNFSYTKDVHVLNHVSLSILPASLTALVGESGCGKSTIAGLLTRRLVADQGLIQIGDLAYRDIKQSSLLKHVAYVGHQAHLFHATVRENLLMGKTNLSDDQLWQVLKQVNLAQFLENQQGLDTLILEKATNLSGGQAQRLAIARMLLHDASLLIFDEATSNIDVESETIINQLILDLAKTKAVLVISHRLMNIVNADVIYVMQKGSVLTSGTHQSLLDSDAVYLQLWQTQQALEKYRKEQTDEA